MKKVSLILCCAALGIASASAQDAVKPDAKDDMSSCPMHAQHMKEAAAKAATKGHLGDVQKRGEAHEGMGFSQTATTHHFILTSNGGYIQVTANDLNDKDSIEQIQTHLSHISMMFAKGDFSIPHFVHDQTPPGVATMQRLKSQITYTKEDMESGARVLIQTKSPQALTAVHQFLKFQIEDHQTGDPVAVAAAQ